MCTCTCMYVYMYVRVHNTHMYPCMRTFKHSTIICRRPQNFYPIRCLPPHYSIHVHGLLVVYIPDTHVFPYLPVYVHTCISSITCTRSLVKHVIQSIHSVHNTFFTRISFQSVCACVRHRSCCFESTEGIDVRGDGKTCLCVHMCVCVN